MAVEIIDPYNFTIAFLFTLAFQLIGWAMAVAMKTETFYDLFGGLNFILVALLTMIFREEYTTRQLVTTLFVVASRAELAGFLLFRVCSRKSDSRFDVAKNSPLLMLVFWTLQAAWVFLIVSPAVLVNSTSFDPALQWSDYLGIVMMAIGFLCEVVADMQKYNFRNNEANKGRVCQVGLWGWSRHPNYFGETLFWWGAFVMTTALLGELPGGWATIISPLFTMYLLLRMSGIPLAEGKNLKRFHRTPESAAEFTEYFEQTSPLIPCPPACYKALPSVLKLLCCFEFPSYRYDPSREKETDELANPVNGTSGDTMTSPGGAEAGGAPEGSPVDDDSTPTDAVGTV